MPAIKYPIILLMAKSGAGKSTVASLLRSKYGWKDIDSYTTRPMRCEDETGHIFISEEEFNKIPQEDMAAYTKFDEHRCCTTNSQANQANIYVIDPDGIIYFKQHYTGNKNAVVVYLTVSDDELSNRMLKRGDTDKKVIERLEHDKKAFIGGRMPC